MGSNWTDRRGDKCSWYLESDQGDTFEGRQCLEEGPTSHNLLPGDVVSVELIDGLATFCVNYQPYATGIKVCRYPATFCVLYVSKGDSVTLLRNESMSMDEYSEWMQTWSERSESWRAVTHERILAQQKEAAAALLQQSAQQQRSTDRDKERERQRELMDMERQRVENMIEAHDREREERKRRERQERGEVEVDGSASLGKIVTAMEMTETFDEVLSASGPGSSTQEEVERLRRERDEAQVELERARLELEVMKARESSCRDPLHTEVDESGLRGEAPDQNEAGPHNGQGEFAGMVEGLEMDDDDYEGEEYLEPVEIPEKLAAQDEYEQQEGLQDPVNVCEIFVCECLCSFSSFRVLTARDPE